MVMDHNQAVRLKATERYLLNELDTDELEQFEEHLFDCQECALDLRAAATFLEQSKTILSETVESTSRLAKPATAPRRWAWLRPAFVLPVLALLVIAVGYETFVEIPALQQASTKAAILPYATITVATRSANTPVVHAAPGQPFVLLVNIPAEARFSSYVVDLYDPAGRIQWSLPISAEAANDTIPVRIPALREPGNYALSVRGVGQSSTDLTEIGKQPFELRFQ